MQTASALHKPCRWRLLLLFGVLFEMFLLALCALLPKGSWLASAVRNYVVLIHSPLLWIINHGANSDDWLVTLFWLLLCFFGTALFWAFLFHWILRMWAWLHVRLGISRRQKLIVRCGLGFVCAIVLALGIVAALPQTATPFTASPEVKSAVESNTAFALDLYQKLKEKPGNLFFSPYSISSALAMSYAGARNQTERQMARTLHFNLAQTNLHDAFGALGVRMNKVQRWNRITLLTANSLWCQQDYPFEKSFLDLVRIRYGGDARQVDFKKSAEAAGTAMNEWVEEKTKGEIKGIIGMGQLTPYTRLILCNAIYFKGNWQNQFKTSDTKPMNFGVNTNQAVTVPMMWQKSEFKMTHNDDGTVEMLELPYSGTDLCMIIFLPVAIPYVPGFEHFSLPDLEQRLTLENLHAWTAMLDQARLEETSVVLPRFTTAQTFDLANELKSLGMSSAFNDSADFSGIKATTNLFISDVIHKAFVEVNETGTEAAAVSLALVKTRGMTRSFRADHPFIFLIRENGSGTILFIGRIIDPTK
jgi:serine protease inhibitor